MKFFQSVKDLVNQIQETSDNAQVWRGADGSYAVGDTFPIDVEEGETEYTEAGKAEEYK